MAEPRFDNAAWERAQGRVWREHPIALFDTAGGTGWSCGCGKERHPGSGYPTQRQAQARANRHLMAEGKKLYDAERRHSNDSDKEVRVAESVAKADESNSRCEDITSSPRGPLRCILLEGHDRDPLSLHTIDLGSQDSETGANNGASQA